jgi:sulfonate transport system substrate-binding protein
MNLRSFASLLFGAALFWSGSPCAAVDQPKVIRIGLGGSGYGKTYTSGVFGYLKENKLLEDEFKPDGIRVEWSFFPGIGPELNTAFASNTVDISSYGDFPAIIGKAAGVKFKAIAVTGRDAYIYVTVPINSTAQKIEDLKGKTVGIYMGGYMRLIFARKLEALGLSEKDFKFVNIRPADGQNAIACARIDAYVGSANLLIARNLGIARIIYTSKNEPADWRGMNVLLVSESFLHSYPEIARRLLKRYLQGVRWRSDEANRSQAQELDSRAGTPLEVIAEVHAGTPLKELYNPRFDEAFVNHYKNAISLAKKTGLIQKEFDVETWINRELLEQVLAEIDWH